eukprot:s4020_g3.t1
MAFMPEIYPLFPSKKHKEPDAIRHIWSSEKYIIVYKNIVFSGTLLLGTRRTIEDSVTAGRCGSETPWQTARPRHGTKRSCNVWEHHAAFAANSTCSLVAHLCWPLALSIRTHLIYVRKEPAPLTATMIMSFAATLMTTAMVMVMAKMNTKSMMIMTMTVMMTMMTLKMDDDDADDDDDDVDGDG